MAFLKSVGIIAICLLTSSHCDDAKETETRGSGAATSGSDGDVAKQPEQFSEKAAAGLLKLIMQMSPKALRSLAGGDPALKTFLSSDEYQDPQKLMEMIKGSSLFKNPETMSKLAKIAGVLNDPKSQPSKSCGSKAPSANKEL
eukprot:TRINITY_DN91508_c0_g1_i1.p1 TRINITY_DN91508_c0_g1~~TRINITY_DN91508_c0_g1_i1.p1  ORF type:complete len:143 (+),score=22.12 TRINITY_DN91508_c0_g1_i1:65-493(+)